MKFLTFELTIVTREGDPERSVASDSVASLLLMSELWHVEPATIVAAFSATRVVAAHLPAVGTSR